MEKIKHQLLRRTYIHVQTMSFRMDIWDYLRLFFISVILCWFLFSFHFLGFDPLNYGRCLPTLKYFLQAEIFLQFYCPLPLRRLVLCRLTQGSVVILFISSSFLDELVQNLRLFSQDRNFFFFTVFLVNNHSFSLWS